MTSRSKGLGRQLLLAIFVMLAGVLLTLGWGSYRYLVTSLHEREVELAIKPQLPDQKRANDETQRSSTAAYGVALPRAAENATMQGFPHRAPTLTATGESVGPRLARDTVARGPALAPAFP